MKLVRLDSGVVIAADLIAAVRPVQRSVNGQPLSALGQTYTQHSANRIDFMPVMAVDWHTLWHGPGDGREGPLTDAEIFTADALLASILEAMEAA